MKLRHVFYVKPPEEVVTVSPLPYSIVLDIEGEEPDTDLANWYAESKNNRPNVFLDVLLHENAVVVLGWGCVIDGQVIQPVWVTPEIIEREKQIAARQKKL